METKEDYDAYKYISPYARQRQRQLDIALTSKGALTTQARNYPDGGPLSSEIPCDPTPFNATEIISGTNMDLSDSLIVPAYKSLILSLK